MHWKRKFGSGTELKIMPALSDISIFVCEINNITLVYLSPGSLTFHIDGQHVINLLTKVIGNQFQLFFHAIYGHRGLNFQLVMLAFFSGILILVIFVCQIFSDY